MYPKHSAFAKGNFLLFFLLLLLLDETLHTSHITHLCYNTTFTQGFDSQKCRFSCVGRLVRWVACWFRSRPVPLIDWELMKRNFGNMMRRLGDAAVADGGGATAGPTAAAAEAAVAAAETAFQSATADALAAHEAADVLIRVADEADRRTAQAEDAVRAARDALKGSGAGGDGPAAKAAASAAELEEASEAAAAAVSSFKKAQRAVLAAKATLGSSIAKASAQLSSKGNKGKGKQVQGARKKVLQNAIAAAKNAVAVQTQATAGRARRVESFRTHGLGDLGSGDSLVKYPAPVCLQANRKVLAQAAGATTAANARKAAGESFGYALGKLLALTAVHGVSTPEQVLPPPPIKPANWNAVMELSSFISCTLGLIMYGIRKLDASIVLHPVAYLHISLQYVFEALEAGDVKTAELRALKATTWTQGGRPSTGAISGGDLFVNDQVVFFHTDERGEIVGAFAAIISWRCIYVPDAELESE
jgi:hypothetical protein